MKYNNLARTSLKVSALSLGTMTFGGQTSEKDSLSIMDYAFENGINVFDTANVYNQGESERIVGKALKGRRSEIILATKVNGQMGKSMNDRGLSRRNILNALDASLKRLDTDYTDIYYLHAPDYETALDETLGTMNALVESGKIRYIGVSNFAAWQIADIFALCDKRNYVTPIITQNVYNLITRGIEAELTPFLSAHHMALTIYNPIAGGLLSGKHTVGEQPQENTRFSTNKMYFNRYWSKENFQAVEKLTQIATDCGLTLLQLAMKWCIENASVTSTISGVSKLSQLQQNIESLEGDCLEAETLAACDAVWHSLPENRFSYMR
jgi:1-deoxyxylulose-5-phosphate synthase